MNSSRKGDIGLTKIIAHLVEAGCYVFLPIAEQPKFDFVIEKDGVLAKVEAKFAKEKNVSIDTNDIVRNLDINAAYMLVIKAFEIILDNAVRFSPENKTIKITARKVNGNKQIEFTDFGPGFSEEKLKELFKPFEVGLKHDESHSGISLCAVKMIMESHNGEISVKNNEVGSTVTLTFKNHLS